MRNRILAMILAAAVLMSLLCGCDLFTSGSGESTGSETPEAGGPVELTEKYTFEDPKGLEYARRYVLYGGETCTTVAGAKEAGYGLVSMWSILYADAEGAPVYDYEFMICDSEESAENVKALYKAQGQVLNSMDQDPCVLGASTDGDTLTGTMVALQSAGVLSDTTVSGYVEFMKSNMGLTEK